MSQTVGISKRNHYRPEDIDEIKTNDKIVSVTISPKKKIYVGTRVTITVAIRYSGDKITKIYFEIINNMRDRTIRELELLNETEEVKTYQGSFIAESININNCTIHVQTETGCKSTYRDDIVVTRPTERTGYNIQTSTKINQSKLFYFSLCMFFVIGAFVTAYVNGQQVESIPDMSKHTPDNYVGYLNNYLMQKVNPMTLGDVLITEYIDHPDEPTGVVPLYPAQAVMQEQSMVNCSITEIETYLVPDENNTYGTVVGIGLYVKRGDTGKWNLKKYDTISTAGDGKQAIKVVIETPRITFDAEGGGVRVVITNFGTEVNEAIYVPTISKSSKKSSFSGMNTIVDAENALFLTIKNRYQVKKGQMYYVDYKKHVGLQLHKITYKQDNDNNAVMNSDEIIAIFDYPTLKRKDSITNQYSNFRTLFNSFLSVIDPKLIMNLEDVLIQIPIIGSLFKYKSYETDLSYTTASQRVSVNILEYGEQIVESSQNNLEQATNPAIQTMLLTRKIDVQHPSDYYELMEYFNHTFVRDYNEFDKWNKFTFSQIDWKTFKLELTGQRQTEWFLDLTKSMDTMVTERNPIPGRDDIEDRSFRWLLNKLNGDYYSSRERGFTGIQKIKKRVETHFRVERSGGENFKHLTRQVENIAVPNYDELGIISDPALGTFSLVNEEGNIVQRYDMINSRELAGRSVSLLASQSEKIFLWLQKTFGPWSNLQIPDEQPAYEWRDTLYSMDDDRDENEIFLSGSTNNINSLMYNGVERPLDLTIQSEDTPRGWYRGDATYDYLTGMAYANVSDNDWDTPGMGLNVGLNSTIDIELVGGWIAGEDGMIMATTDGGKSWKEQQSGINSSIIVIDFFNTVIGVAISEYDVLITYNGGVTWTVLQELLYEHPSFGLQRPYLWDIVLSDEQTAWVLGTTTMGTFFRVDIRNQNWTWVSKIPLYLHDLAMVNNTHGWATGGFSAIVKTTDGWQTYEEQDAGVSQNFHGIFFWDVFKGWVVGTDNTILATTDGGQHWHVQYSYRPFLAEPGTVAKVDVFFITESKGWAVGGGIHYTKDGGKSWYDLGSETTGPSRIVFANETHGWAVWYRKERSYITSVGGVPPIDENLLNLGASSCIFLGVSAPLFFLLILIRFQARKVPKEESTRASNRLCPTCGGQILPKAKFCINCGELLQNDHKPSNKQ